VSRTALAVLLVGAGILHFVIPRPYQRIVPRFLGHAPFLVAASGVIELAAGALVAVPRTRRVGAGLAFVLFLVVWPANVQMAIDAGRPDGGLSALIAWLRVPLQVPLLVWAWRLALPPR